VSCGKRSLPQMKYKCFFYIQVMRSKHLEKSIYHNLRSMKMVAVVSRKRFDLRRRRFSRLNYVNDIQNVLFSKKQKNVYLIQRTSKTFLCFSCLMAICMLVWIAGMKQMTTGVSCPSLHPALLLFKKLQAEIKKKMASRVHTKNCQSNLISVHIINRIKKLLYLKLGLNVIMCSSRRLIL